MRQSQMGEGEGKVLEEEIKHEGRFQRICVFCSSRPGYKYAFGDVALELGKLLSGGYGTMEELLEVIAWSQLEIHDKLVRLFSLSTR
ncbi:hypothetical protein Ahy_B01g053356 [Arachis hypogaea]|uniref:cytokinin riboside 5'-monophosphate phosphoribohydrolase n=1 Tax=Arachis hypogaea TaxID=3818 RepID=A0A445ARN3_ARAHY|nr:hypothetical protein Ahy_B01g053356 [Arachis hypogaea]